jgi:WD40 repeat protein
VCQKGVSAPLDASGLKARVVRALSGHADRVTSATFSTNSTKLITTSNDGNARLWDATTGSLVATLAEHIGSSTTLFFPLMKNAS